LRSRGTASRAPGPEVGGAASPHRKALEALGLEPPGGLRLEAYLDLVARWGARVNLTAARTPEARVELLVAPVLPAVPLPRPGRLLDVGSGNGSPGLVLALLRDDLEVVLLEPRAKRWAFLREAARAAGRPGVEVLRLRHDQYRGAPAETVTVRAVSVPPAELAPLLVPGGRLLVFGGQTEEAPPFRRESTHPLGLGQLHVFRRDVSRET
jgi:16S rRNA (guanine527-N7)-methyltransferase